MDYHRHYDVTRLAVDRNKPGPLAHCVCNLTIGILDFESFEQIMLIMFPLNMVDYPMFSLLLSTQFFWC